MPSDNPKIKGVVFDMDGLLLDSERLYFEAFRDTHRALDLPQDDALFLSMVGTTMKLGRMKLETGLAGRVPLATFEEQWAKDCAAHTARGIAVKPGVLDLVIELQNREIPYAIATSTPTARAHHHLEEAGLHIHFKTVIGGDKVSRSKPAPDIYLAASAALDLDPHTCAAFEDSENGVRAAVAAKLITVQIPDLIDPPDHVRALGHTVAPDLMAGAHAIGLLR